MKITTKTTKQELKDFLGANALLVKKEDKDLFQRLSYADAMLKKDETKVQRRDLAELAREVQKLLGDKCVDPADEVEETDDEQELVPIAENSVKKLGNGISKKQPLKKQEVEESDDEDEEEDEEEQEEKAPAKNTKVDNKSAKKSLGKKEQPKKDGVTVLNTDAQSSSKKAVQLAKAFPQTLEIGDSKYELAPEIESMDDLYEALTNDEEIVFAYYWTKRHLKQFPYFGDWLGHPDSFENDLDLAQSIYVSDEKKVSYQVSMYTDAVYTILPKDFEVVDGVRIAGGIEYQIYRAV